MGEIQSVTARSTLRRLTLYILFFVIAGIAAVSIITIKDGLEGETYVGGRIVTAANNDIQPCPSIPLVRQGTRVVERTAIYVLCGTQYSLTLKYRAAAEVYRRGGIDNILVASTPGITVYDKSIGRNLTNDEWSVKQLTDHRVRSEEIHFIKLKDGFFGTLREARTLRDACIERNIERLLLVCSTYHSKRVLNAFSTILEGTNVKIEIFSTNEEVGFGRLFLENVKVILYKYVLIPLDRQLRNIF